MEKTATFLGHSQWANLLPRMDDGNIDPFLNRILNLYSHSAHAGDETMVVGDEEKEKLKEFITLLTTKYGFKEQAETSESL